MFYNQGPRRAPSRHEASLAWATRVKGQLNKAGARARVKVELELGGTRVRVKVELGLRVRWN